MSDADKIRQAVEGYFKAFDALDPDAVIALYAEDCTVEDPVGSPVIRGRAAVLDFYRRSMMARPKLHLSPPIRIAGNEAAFAFHGFVDTPNGRLRFDVIDHMVFDAAGKIVSMRAFFGPTNMRPADE